MANKLVLGAALVIGGGVSFFRGLRPFLLEERYTVAPRIQLIAGLLTAAAGMFWLMDSIVSSLIPVN